MFSVLQGGYDPAIVVIVAALVIGCAGIPGLFLRTPGPGQICASVITNFRQAITLMAKRIQYGFGQALSGISVGVSAIVMVYNDPHKLTPCAIGMINENREIIWYPRGIALYDDYLTVQDSYARRGTCQIPVEPSEDDG